MKMYVEYTLYFNERESRREITDLKQMMEDLKLDRKRQEIQREEDKERMNRQENYIRSLGVSLEDIKDQNNEIKNQNKEIKRRLSIAVEDRAPLPEQSSKQERFVLLKRNDPEHPAYYTIELKTLTQQTESELKLFFFQVFKFFSISNATRIQKVCTCE
jgi:chromosome segregation ATPase